MNQMPNDAAALARIGALIHDANRFVVTSHVKPDGDAMGSTVAMTLALRALGKQADAVLRDPLPDPYGEFEASDLLQHRTDIADDGSVVIVMECGDLERTGLSGLERHRIINIDHHPGNAGYGEVVWFDPSAAACAEMVYAVMVSLGVGLTRTMATQLYVAVVTDTGWFRYPGVSPRTFDIAARLVEAGADPVAVSRTLHDGLSLTRVTLQAAVMATLEIGHDGRIATLFVNPAMMARVGATPDDTEGIINLPLAARVVEAVAFFKQGDDGQCRVSLRSKGAVDVGRIARLFGGGGHKNASGCTLTGSMDDIRTRILDPLTAEVSKAGTARG